MKTGPVRLALLAASPIYYQTPLYQRVAADPHIDFTAIFASNGGIRPHDAGYGRPIVWDIDLLRGYRSVFLRKAEKNPIHGSFFSLFDADIVSVLVRGRYEILWIHGYNFATHLLANLTQKALRGGVLVREEQTLLHKRPPLKTAVKEIGLRLLFRGAGALYIGSQNRRWFEHYGVPTHRLFFTPYCVDNLRFQAESTELRDKQAELRREFGVADRSGPLILTVSRLIPKKNPLALLEAFKRLRRERLCTLLVVGSGELEAAMRRKVREEAIPDVVFAGFVNQTTISRAYAAADVFALVSENHETWGLAVNEAMNFSLPIVASSKVGSATDLVRDGRNGFVVPPDQPERLATVLRELVDSPATREQFGRASLEIVRDWNYGVTARGVLGGVAEMVGSERWAAATAQSA